MKVLNAKETAKYIGRSERTTLTLLHTGIIPAVRLDKHWMVAQSAIDEWLIVESRKQANLRKHKQLVCR